MVKQYSIRSIFDFYGPRRNDIVILKYVEYDPAKVCNLDYEPVEYEGELDALHVDNWDQYIVNEENVEQLVKFVVRDPKLNHGHIDPLGKYKPKS